MKKVIKLAVRLSVLLLAAGMLAQSSNEPKAAEARNDKPAEAVQDAGVSSDYVIGADDMLKFRCGKSRILPRRCRFVPMARSRCRCSMTFRRLG